MFTSQQNFLLKYIFMLKSKQLFYYHLRQCLSETRLSSQNKHYTNLSQVTDKLSHNVVSSTIRQERVRTHTFSGDRH
jgi:hypothetical protein